MLEKEKISAILAQNSWEAVFSGLAACGLSYVRKGGGAVIRSETGEIKASSVGREFSLYYMRQRLGPMPEKLEPTPIAPAEDSGHEWEEFEEFAKAAASLRFHILLAVRNGDSGRLEQLSQADSEAAYFTERFQWLTANGRKALPDSTVCEQWIRQGHFPEATCNLTVWDLYRDSDDELVNGYFGIYQDALGADSFHVICASPDGRKMRFHELEGYPEGVPAAILPDFFGRLLVLNKRGEMIAFKPVSSKWHYIFIHNVTCAGLDKLLELGIAPAYVQEISEMLFQIIVKIPKTGNADADKIIELEMSRALNLIAGDCLPGSRRPHFAPGFTNWRGIERDGVFPISGSVLNDGAFCEALAGYGEWALENRPGPLVGVFETENEPVQADAETLYGAHERHILRIGHETIGNADPSELDMKIATRLRATGHSEEEVAGIIAAVGRKKRPGAHDWDDYSRRTARKAFSDDRVLLGYERYFDKWRELELRAACLPQRAGAMT